MLVNISDTVRASAKNAQTDFYGIGCLPTNYTIAKFIPNDLDLLIQGKKYEILISRKC